MDSKLDEDKISTMVSEILLGGNQIYFYDLKTKESFYQIDAYGEFFIIENQKIEWDYSKETKQIGDYVCHKATTMYRVENAKGVFNHNVTAWYATEIPINVGPRGYHGLPGLILELQEFKRNYVVSKIELNPEEKINIIKPKKGKRMTQKEFDELGKTICFSRKQ